MQKPTIDQYLVATCLFTIDDFNILYRGYNKEDLKKEADEKFNEIDIAIRLGYPFRQNARYTGGDNKKGKKAQKINHDLYIEPHNFRVEIKYLRNWLSSSDTWSVSMDWSRFQQDFNWLMDEIDYNGNGKTAFVIGWFNCVESFSQLMQLGTGGGAYPLADEKKLPYFPFLIRGREPARAKDLKYNYDLAYKVQTINQIGTRKGEYHCMFLGSESDCFHFAIYY